MRLLAKLCALLAILAATGASAATFKTIYKFCPIFTCTDGSGPFGPLTVDEAGNLYGTASTGGPTQGGVVFELVANADRTDWTYKILYRFCHHYGSCNDGQQPQGGLIRDVHGSLYGVTTYGGDDGKGTVYQLQPDADGVNWTHRVLHRFCKSGSCEDGRGPGDALTYEGAQTGAPYDGQSPLYGVAGFAGSYDKGVLYSLTPNGKGGWEDEILYRFCCDQVPSGTPLFVDGDLYGLTGLGGDGPTEGGTFYRLTRGPHHAWLHTLLYSFDGTIGSPGGYLPVGPLFRDASGKFFGTALAGGTTNQGTLFTLKTGEKGMVERARYSFCQNADQCKDGHEPRDGVVAGADGTLFGVTVYGGDSEFISGGGGTIFEFHRGKLKQLHAFCTKQDCSDGSYPMALTPDGHGNLFGVTHGGGNGAYDGTVFELTP